MKKNYQKGAGQKQKGGLIAQWLDGTVKHMSKYK
jgi:hypothetical protein